MAIQQRLEGLLQRDMSPWLARDPLRFPRRYSRPKDQEIVGLLSAMLAYGRVELFGPVVERILGLMEEEGGPSCFVDKLGSRQIQALSPILYRWNRHPDFALLFQMLQRVRGELGSLGAVFEAGDPKSCLGGGIGRLRARVPVPRQDWSQGFRTWLPAPEDGSACKRWWLLMRWMVRQQSPDLGIWLHLDPAQLLIPLDTHVSRIAKLVGLSSRSDAGWKTAEEITSNLRIFCPDDPVRYDFALAHLGISEGCQGRFVAEICGVCPLQEVCTSGKG